MVWIDEQLENYIKNSFPDRRVHSKHKARTWQSSRFLWVTTYLSDDDELHYEYFHNRVELHLEGKFQCEDYREFAKQLRVRTARNPDLSWERWQGHSQCRCVLNSDPTEPEDLKEAFSRLMGIFDPIIKELSEKVLTSNSTEPYAGDTNFNENGLKDDSVSLENCSLGKLFGNPLVIPEYQRNYSWGDKQVKNLLKSLDDIPLNGKYHLGTVILQKTHDGNYAIIDGQQRLVTLTLLCLELKYKGEMPLAQQSFRSTASRKQIANNRYLIRQYCSRLHDEKMCGKMINNLVFSTLILVDSRLDLAYTFFSNENSKGVPLTDYDLLKAHHLRFIFNEGQAEHLANRWNNLTAQKYEQLDATLSEHLFRLRKWMRKRNFDASEKYRTKEEFSAAITVADIPPFGEKFEYNEKMQGGTHFFAYAEHFVDRYNIFEKTPQVEALRRHLRWESHWRYKDVIESLLFGYYLKFGIQYLTEALFCIASNIAQHRYNSSRALTYKILDFARQSELTMMIDQSSSPTFFLAESLSQITVWGKDLEENDIKMRFFECLQDMFSELYDTFSDKIIVNKYHNEYE